MSEEIQQKKSNTKRVVLVILAILLLGMGGWMVLAHVAPTQVASPVAVVKKTTDNIYYAVKEDDLKKAAAQLPPHINILITGLDNRLGQNDNHADAVHLFTIFPDKGTIEITSVPRDTKCFIDSTFPDSLSHFSNARSKLGRKGYIHTAEEFLNKGKMDYWIELNFSTVMGILQLIGYKDPATALQFLRHRKSFPIGDVQRSHNQAVFMKQAIVKYFNLMTGMSGDFLLTAGLGMIETNLTKEACEGLIYKLKQKGFPNNPDAITLKMEPPPPGKFEDITINPDNVDATVSALMDKTYQVGYSGRPDAAGVIQEHIDKAVKDSSKSYEVIHDLEGIADQHGWLQVTDLAKRDSLRGRIGQLLCSAYTRSHKPEKAAALKTSIDNEAKLFRNKEDIFSGHTPVATDTTHKETAQ